MRLIFVHRQLTSISEIDSPFALHSERIFSRWLMIPNLVLTIEAFVSSVCDSATCSSDRLYLHPCNKTVHETQESSDIDLFTRKPSARGKHSSNYRILPLRRRVEWHSRPWTKKHTQGVPTKRLSDVVKKIKGIQRYKRTIAYVPTEEESRFATNKKTTPFKPYKKPNADRCPSTIKRLSASSKSSAKMMIPWRQLSPPSQVSTQFSTYRQISAKEFRMSQRKPIVY